MSSQKGAAPDVDLRSRGTGGFGVHVVGGVLAVGAAYYFYGRDHGQDPALSPEDAAESLWWFWTLVWLLTRLFQLVLGIVVLLLLVLVARQRTILYVPVPPNTSRSPRENPGHLRSPDCSPWHMDYENVTITTEDGVKINAWFIYHRATATTEVPYTVLYFHGNAGNIGHRLENLRDMHKHLNLNILILDYRGYGDSEDGGGPTEQNFMLDAKAAYRWLVDRIRNPPSTEKAKMSLHRILFFGRSIGGVVALRMAAQLLKERKADAEQGKTLQPLPAGLVLENTFTSLSDMAVQVFPFLYYLKPILRSPIIFDEWKGNEALDYMVQNSDHWCICLLSGLKDALVPPAQMAALHALIKRHPPKVLKYFKFTHGGHNDTPIQGGQDYWHSFKKYLDLVVESEPERKAHFAAEDEKS